MIRSSSVSYKNPYFDFTPKKQAILAVVALLVVVELLYVLLVALSLSRIYASKSFRLSASLFFVVSFFRLLVSKLLFLPIFHLLSYSVSCHYYQDLGLRMCSFNREIGCIFSPASKIGVVERYLVIASFIALIWHTVSGLVSELFDFSFKISSFESRPK